MWYITTFTKYACRLHYGTPHPISTHTIPHTPLKRNLLLEYECTIQSIVPHLYTSGVQLTLAFLLIDEMDQFVRGRRQMAKTRSERFKRGDFTAWRRCTCTDVVKLVLVTPQSRFAIRGQVAPLG